MTEQEWFRCKDPQRMLEFLEGKVGERKLRLFAVACCRRISKTRTYARAHKAVEVAEHYADGLATSQELREAGEAAWKGARWTRDGTRSAAVAASEACSSPAKTHQFLTCVNVVCNHIARGFDRASWTAYRTERSALAALLRDVFGPLPFRPIALAPAWLTWHGGLLVSMAGQMYDSRDFSDMPVLADALEESGCQDQDILGHCRSGVEHVRGCWVVDLILGRS